MDITNTRPSPPVTSPLQPKTGPCEKHSRIATWFLSTPMVVKMMGIALGVGALVGAGLVWQIRYDYSAMEMEEVEDYAELTANLLATTAAPMVQAGDQAGVARLVEEVIRHSPVWQKAAGNPLPASDLHNLIGAVNAVGIWDGAGRLVASVGPLDPRARVRQASVALAGGAPGKVVVAFNESHSRAEVIWHVRRILLTAVVIGLLGMVIAWWLARLCTRPIQALVQATQAVTAGDYQAHIPALARDEVGQLAAAFNEMVAALQRKNAINRHLLRKVIDAGEEERKRVARELHDQTGQSLISLIAGLAALENETKSAKPAELRALAARTLEEVHDLSHALRPSVLEDLGLVTALQRLCQTVAQRFGVTVECAVIGLDDTVRLAGEIEVALYRITQEALTNAVRHGQAQSIEVMVQRKPASVLVVIEDNGRGFEGSDWRARCLREDHLGLLGMEERAVLLGGTLRVESRLGAGTHVFAEIPLPGGPHA